MSDYNKKLTVLLPLGKLDQFVGLAIDCLINQTFTDFVCYVLSADRLGPLLRIAQTSSSPARSRNCSSPGNAYRWIALAIP